MKEDHVIGFPTQKRSSLPGTNHVLYTIIVPEKYPHIKRRKESKQLPLFITKFFVNMSVVSSSLKESVSTVTYDYLYTVVMTFTSCLNRLTLFTAMLASRGFASLALAYFNYEDLPKTLEVLELEYFEEATEFLLSQPEVIPDRCGVVSSSKGSDTALAMGIHLDKVKAVVCIGGMVVATTNTLTYRGLELWKGVQFSDDNMTFDHMNRVVQKESIMREILRHDHPLLPSVEAASDDTHFLLVAGDQDTYHTKYGVEAIRRRMEMHGREDQVHTIVYPGAGHIIETPYNTLSDHSHYQLPVGKVRDLVLYWGGEARPTCHAQKDLWRQLRSFLARHVRDCSRWYQRLLEQSSTEAGVA